MTDFKSRDSRVVLTTPELEALNSMLKAGDRAGFYLTYYSMTDSSEALLQSKIATFSGLAGGAAFAANRFLEDQYGGAGGRYQGIYWLSQQVAQSAYNAISDSVTNNTNGGTGKIDDRPFFDSAAVAWNKNGIGDLFPGNIFGPFGPGWLSLLTPGAAEAFAATAYAPDVGKKISDFPSSQLVTIADGSTIAVDASGHVQAVFAPVPGDTQVSLGYSLHVSEDFPNPADPAVLANLLGGQTPAAFTETNTTTYNGDVNPQNTNGGFDSAKFATSSTGTDGSDLILTQGDANGGLSDDVIIGGAAGQTLSGGDGNDIIWGRGGVDAIYGGAGDDVLRGGAGDDILTGGAGNDLIDGGDVNLATSEDGIDTAKFDDQHGGGIQLSSVNGASSGPRDTFLLVTRGAEVDTLHSIEKLMLSDGADIFTVAAGTDLKSLQEIDAGANPDGTEDVFDASAYDGKLQYKDGHIIGDGIDIKLDNFERVELPPSGNDDTILTGSIKELDTGNGNDTVKASGQGTFIDLGAGNDTLKSSAPGTIVKTGAGNDTVEISHDGQLLIEDASTSDRLTSYGATLTGGVRWGGSESVYAYGLHGEKYGRNSQGDLIILDANGNETFIPRFNFSTDGTNRTAGVYVIEVTFKIVRGNIWTTSFEAAASMLKALEKVGEALYGWKPHGNDPLVLDLNGDGISLSAQQASSVSFDIDKDGFAEGVGWINGSDGFLVRDLNGNGKIDDVGEMFGNPTDSGFTALATLDGNHDGKVDALDDGLADFNGDGVIDSGDTFDSLKVWVDANQNGQTDAGELHSLSDYNIVSISVNSTPSTATDSGNAITATGTFQRADGTTGTVGDVQLDTDNFNTKWLGDSTVSAAAASRPQLKGFGTLTDLRVAMTLSPALMSVVDAALPALNTLSMASLRDAGCRRARRARREGGPTKAGRRAVGYGRARIEAALFRARVA